MLNQPIKQSFILSGSVGVYSACDKQAKPLYCSTAKTGKHTDPVWEVRLSVDFPKSAVRCSWKRRTFVTRKRAKFTGAFLLR